MNTQETQVNDEANCQCGCHWHLQGIVTSREDDRMSAGMPYVSDGNKKMTLPTFSLPAKQTCPGCTSQCAAKCYARKAEIAYPAVLPSRKRGIDVHFSIH